MAETRLQAMYHSKQVSAYIISKLPEGNLATGWIEKGLVSKGLPGNLLDKDTQESLLIPIDRFARLVREYEQKVSLGLFILGEHGADTPKLVTIIDSCSSSSFQSIGFRSDNIQMQDLIDAVSRFLSNKSKAVLDNDPNLDYIEEILSDVADGGVCNLLSFSVPSGKQKAVGWIQKLLKTDLKSEEVLAQHGNPLEISSATLMVTRWLLGLDLFKKTKNAIATLLLLLPSHIVLYLWDSPQNLTTFVLLEGDDTEKPLRKYTIPLWYAAVDSIKEKPKGPKVIVQKAGIQKPIAIQKRKPDPLPADSQSITILRTRLTELINRLSQLVSHISKIKKRTTRVIKDTRVQSMNKHSENVIEELQRIEDETKILEDISTRLRQLEKQIENVTSQGSTDSPLSPDEIQRIVSKMTVLRELIDKIEVEIGQLDSRTTEIESLKFKRQTE